MMENIVISDRLLFSSISYELRDKNISFYMPHKNGDRITNHFKIKSPLDKNIDKKFLLVTVMK